MPIGVVRPKVLPHQLRQQIPVGAVVVALAFLLGDHVTLGVEVLLGHRETAQPIRFQPEHQLQRSYRHALMVDGAVSGGESVDVTAGGLNHGHVLAGGDLG